MSLGYHEIRVLYPKKLGDEELADGLTLIVEDGAAKGFRTLMDYGLLTVECPEDMDQEGYSEGERRTVLVNYISTKEEDYPPGSVLVVPDDKSKAFRKMIGEGVMLRPRRIAGALQRLTVAEGVEDNHSAHVIARYYKALQTLDAEMLTGLLHPDCEMVGHRLAQTDGPLVGKENIERYLLNHWSNFIDQFDDPVCEFICTQISTHSAYMTYRIKGIDMVLSTEYEIEDYKIRRIVHLRREGDSGQEIGEKQLEALKQAQILTDT